jgi:hypothetical protein
LGAIGFRWLLASIPDLCVIRAKIQHNAGFDPEKKAMQAASEIRTSGLHWAYTHSSSLSTGGTSIKAHILSSIFEGEAAKRWPASMPTA